MYIYTCWSELLSSQPIVKKRQRQQRNSNDRQGSALGCIWILDGEQRGRRNKKTHGNATVPTGSLLNKIGIRTSNQQPPAGHMLWLWYQLQVTSSKTVSASHRHLAAWLYTLKRAWLLRKHPVASASLFLLDVLSWPERSNPSAP